MTPTEITSNLDWLTRRIVEGFGPDRILLLGSHARGTAADSSDVDVLIVMPLAGSARAMAAEIDCALAARAFPLDVIVMTPEQFERQSRMTGSFVAEALRTGRMLYDRAA